MIPILVSILECRTYDIELVKSGLIQSINNLGGLDTYLTPSDKVLLKVNLIMRKAPQEAATTHPIFVQALAEIIGEYGCDVIIGDSPGGPFSEPLLRSVYRHTGMEEAARLSGARLNFDTGTVQVENPKGKLQKKLTAARFVTEADKIISVAKLKSHCMTKMTGATKNMFGIVPGTVKAEYHFNRPDPENFVDCLIDICEYANPVLSFIDGIVAMEGHGPTGGVPREIGLIGASTSPYELDLAMSKVMNLPLKEAPLIGQMIQRELCSPHWDDIKTVGDDLNRFVQKDFDIPKTSSMHFLGDNPPAFLANFVRRNLHPKPVIREDLCIGCGDCAANCPPKVITMKNKLPDIALDGCIRCFCCQELCPKKAVDIKRPLLLRILSKF